MFVVIFAESGRKGELAASRSSSPQRSGTLMQGGVYVLLPTRVLRKPLRAFAPLVMIRPAGCRSGIRETERGDEILNFQEVKKEEEEEEEDPKLYEVIRADHDYIELLVKVKRRLRETCIYEPVHNLSTT